MISKAANSANKAPDLSAPSWKSLGGLVDGAGRGHPRIELDFAKGALVVRDILVQDRGQSLGLLRAQIYSLEVSYFDLVLRLLLHGTEHQKEVPDIHPHLDAIGIGFAIVTGVEDIKIRLRRDNHSDSSLSQAEGDRGSQAYLGVLVTLEVLLRDTAFWRSPRKTVRSSESDPSSRIFGFRLK